VNDGRNPAAVIHGHGQRLLTVVEGDVFAEVRKALKLTAKSR
jgi:hypothetical protein